MSFPLSNSLSNGVILNKNNNNNMTMENEKGMMTIATQCDATQTKVEFYYQINLVPIFMEGISQ